MMKVLLFIFVLISCSSGFFLGGLLGGQQQERPHRPPPPQRHLVKIITDQPRLLKDLSQPKHLSNGVSGSLHNAAPGLIDNALPGSINPEQLAVLNNGASGLSHGQSGLLNNRAYGLNSAGPVTIIRVIHEGSPIGQHLNSNGVLRVIHEHISLPSPSVVSHGHGQNYIGHVNQINQQLTPLGPAPIGQIPLGQGQLGVPQIAPLVNLPPTTLLNSGAHQGYSYPAAPLHHQSYNRGG